MCKQNTKTDIHLGLCFQLLIPERMKLLESTSNNITKSRNCEKVHHLEINEAVLIYCSNDSNDYQ